MAIDNADFGGSKEGPFNQFALCHYTENSCKYKDVNGYCIFENCVVDGTNPPAVLLHYYECIICKNVDCCTPMDLKAHICTHCLERIQAAEVLPHTCRWCGASVDTPPTWMFSGLCEECLGRLKRAAWEHDFNDLR